MPGEPSTLNSTLAVVLAAGKGTRMESDLPKVLVPVCNRPMIRYVVDALHSAGITRIVAVIGHQGELVVEELSDEVDVEFVEQREQLGTGHAVMMCREQLASHEGPVLVVAGDSPMLQPRSIKALVDEYGKCQPACLLGTAHHEHPQGLGRIVRSAAGDFVAIVEEGDATSDEKAIKEVNMSTYLFAAADLVWGLDQLSCDNVQDEYYLTDCPGILHKAGREVRALQVLRPCEALSINNLDDLTAVEQEMERQRKVSGNGI